LQPQRTPAQQRRAAQKAERAEQKEKQRAQNTKLSEKRKGVGAKKLSDSIKRFSYLIGQTDVFNHFCELKGRLPLHFLVTGVPSSTGADG
jgi:SWI/SNF-related matrix-associated actin-dependent regulator of chromatin subfamily A member 5